MVGDLLPDVIGVVLRLPEEGRHMRIVHRVLDDIAQAPRLDDATFAQEAQLM